MDRLRGLFRRLVYQYPALDFLELHTQKVCETVEEMVKAVEDYLSEQPVAERSEQVSKLEHEADLLKFQVRSTLPRSDSFMPVNRSDLLEFLWQEDEIADAAQDAAGLLPLMQLKLPPEMVAKWREFSAVLFQAVGVYRRMAEGLKGLLEKGFRKEQVAAVLELLGEVNLLEHRVDVIERELIAMVYGQRELDAFAKYHLIQVLLKLGDILDHMENAGGRIRIMAARA
jgi:predicted phosphate transport protein (TIGR00153 family)